MQLLRVGLADDGGPFGRQKAPLDPEISEVEVEGETYKEHHP